MACSTSDVEALASDVRRGATLLTDISLQTRLAEARRLGALVRVRCWLLNAHVQAAEAPAQGSSSNVFGPAEWCTSGEKLAARAGGAAHGAILCFGW